MVRDTACDIVLGVVPKIGEVVMAMRTRGGDEAIFQSLHRARELYRNRLQANAAADQLACLFAECAIAEVEPCNAEPSPHDVMVAVSSVYNVEVLLAIIAKMSTMHTGVAKSDFAGYLVFLAALCSGGVLYHTQPTWQDLLIVFACGLGCDPIVFYLCLFSCLYPVAFALQDLPNQISSCTAFPRTAISTAAAAIAIFTSPPLTDTPQPPSLLHGRKCWLPTYMSTTVTLPFP
ncbi:hypothetical protein CK203_092323 [Vitis vinifera]|uniref:Uncharacterized protein n=1 Tax=Vitis vinifera TaxID=29760 RepID=A0A438DYI2_VITVI|nr:hypothetical protein CK203_092323 [Vitis vinifera]